MSKSTHRFMLTLSALLLLGVAGGARAELSPPALVSAVPLSGNDIEVRWEDTNTTESTYIVERSSNASGSFVEVGKGGTRYRDGGLALSTTYFYRVRATPPRTPVGPFLLFL